MFRQIKNGQYVAGADLRTKQYYQVKLSSGKLVVCGDGEAGCGVLQNAPNADEACEIVQYGETLVVVGAAIAEGAYFGSSGTGKTAALVPGTDTTKYIHGRITETVSGSPAATRVTKAFVDMAVPRRAS